MHNDNSVRLWWLALCAALVPFLTIHLTFLVSVLEGHISMCVPYWDSCTSISRTGRHGTAYFIFKGTMLPAAIVGVLFWYANRAWLGQLGLRSVGTACVPWLGLVAGLALVIYTVALGHEGEGFNLMRRIGVVLYLSFTFLCELLISGALRQHPVWHRQGQYLLGICQLTLVVGVVSVVLNGLAPGLYSRTDDAFEWVFALLINVHAFWLALLWRRSDFRVRFWVA